MSLREHIQNMRAASNDLLDWSGLIYPPTAADPSRSRCSDGMFVTVRMDGEEYEVPLQCELDAAHDVDEHKAGEVRWSREPREPAETAGVEDIPW